MTRRQGMVNWLAAFWRVWKHSNHWNLPCDLASGQEFQKLYRSLPAKAWRNQSHEKVCIKPCVGGGCFKKALLGLMGLEMHLKGGIHSAEWVGSGQYSLLPASAQCQPLANDLWLGAHSGCYPGGSASASPSTAGAVLGRMAWAKTTSSTPTSSPGSTSLSK